MTIDALIIHRGCDSVGRVRGFHLWGIWAANAYLGAIICSVVLYMTPDDETQLKWLLAAATLLAIGIWAHVVWIIEVGHSRRRVRRR